MAKPFDPRKLLKQIANPLLREFFTRRGELSDVPWNDLTEHKIDPIYEAWQALPEPQNLAIQGILRDVNELADHRGIAAMAEQVSGRYPDRVYPERGDMRQAHQDTAQVADAVAVRILKGARVDLVDDGGAPPFVADGGKERVDALFGL